MVNIEYTHTSITRVYDTVIRTSVYDDTLLLCYYYITNYLVNKIVYIIL